LHISQPALTRRIQELESEYGAELFEGAGKGMTPTEAGLLLQVRARQIVNLDNAVRHELESAGEGLAGMVRIGCVETNGAHALARWLRSWRCLHPRTRVEIYSADSDDLKSHLDAGAIDAALLLGPVEATKYQNVPLPARRRSPPACSKAFL
jgi:DNA-binding transcriptional LysR family regulator